MHALPRSAALALACAAVAGCKLAHEVKPESFRAVQYGEPRDQAIAALDVKPDPLVTFFGGPAHEGTWRAFGCRAEGTHRDYVLLFTQEHLSAVVPMESAQVLWLQRFGSKDSQALPDPAGISAIGAALLNGRLDLATFDFSNVDEAVHARIVQESIAAAVESAVFLPLYMLVWPVMVVALPFAIRTSVEHTDVEEAFLARLDTFHGGESEDDVTAALGNPDSRRAVGSEEVLVFHHAEANVTCWPTSFGFSSGHLAWITNDFTDRSPRTAFVP